MKNPFPTGICTVDPLWVIIGTKVPNEAKFVLVPSDFRKVLADCAGKSALRAALADVCPVPPFAIVTGVSKLNTVPIKSRPVPAE